MPILYCMGFKKTVLCIGGLMLAAGAPITWFSGSDLFGSIKRHWSTGPVATATAGPQYNATTAATDPASTNLYPSASPSNAPADAPMPSLAEVLRFDVTVEWVMQRWPRVSTGLPHLQLQGYRVPLVTGISVADLAGSLTYYFNAQQQVQRITLRGATGDPSVLVALLNSRHHFVRRLTNDPGLLIYEAVDSNNRQVGKLKMRSAPVIRAAQPYNRFDVDLVMDRAE